jgi:hypothetical protein
MVLRVGEAELHLYRKPERPQAPAEPGSQPGGSPEVRQLEFAHLFLDKQEVTVEPGGSATLIITIVNRTNRPDRYLVSVDGIQPSWLANRQFEVDLNPLGQQEIPLIIRPQRKSTSLAKDYPFTVQAVSKANPGPIARVNGLLKVSRFYQFTCNLTPEKFPLNQSAQLVITNLGNTAEIYTAKFENPANELKFQWTEKVTVEPGMTKPIIFKADLNKFRLVGDAKSHLLTAEVTSTSSGEAQTFQGETISKGLVPNWAIIIAGLILLALLAIVVLNLAGLLPRGRPVIRLTPTPVQPEGVLEGVLALLSILLPA